MATYAFETITADQARAIQTGDYLTFGAGSARDVRVSYVPATHTSPALIQLSLQGRTVEFGENLSELSRRGALEMADHSRLLIGGSENDTILGALENDAIYGGAGSDFLRGGPGDDRLQGNAGDDTLYGDGGSNTIYGGQGNDTIYTSTYGDTHGGWAQGNLGDDEIVGGVGNDTLLGGQGNDLLGGSDGNDYLSGDLGNDEILTGDGDDTAFGGAGSDTITSNGGRDLIVGGDGDDQLVVYFSGGSTLDGGAGNDTLVAASAAVDILTGGDGRDVFEFAAKNRPALGQDDQILDWNGADDHLTFAQVGIAGLLPRQYSEFVAGTYAEALATAGSHISGPGAVYVAAQVGADVYVFVETDGDVANGADIAVVLVGRSLADISLQNFI